MDENATRRIPPRYVTDRPLGSALQQARGFASGQIEFMERMAAMDTPVVRIRLGPVPVWVVFDVDLARRVLVADEASYGRPAFIARTFEEAMGPNLFTSSGRAWSRRRRLLQPSFTRVGVDGLVEIMATAITDEVHGWPADTTVDMQPGSPI